MKMADRKLPRWMRKLNVVYQILLSMLTVGNSLLVVVEADKDIDVPKIYYEICSIGLAALPVVWSKFLDSMKEYHKDLTPNDSVNESPPVSP